MRNVSLGIGIGFFIASVIYLVPSALATNAEKQINVLLNSIHVTINGDRIGADNILYQGTAYLPLREISEKLGKTVRWDDHTRTVTISDSQKDDSPPIESVNRGNAAGNLANRGLLAGDSHWTYIAYKRHVANNSQEDGIYKMKPDGSEKTKITSRVGSYLNLDENSLYFVDNGIYRISLDGQNEIKLNEKGSKLLLVGDWLYFSEDQSGIYKMKKDGSEKSKLLDMGALVDISDNNLYYLLNNSIYYINLALRY